MIFNTFVTFCDKRSTALREELEFLLFGCKYCVSFNILQERGSFSNKCFVLDTYISKHFLRNNILFSELTFDDDNNVFCFCPDYNRLQLHLFFSTSINFKLVPCFAFVLRSIVSVIDFLTEKIFIRLYTSSVARTPSCTECTLCNM